MKINYFSNYQPGLSNIKMKKQSQIISHHGQTLEKDLLNALRDIEGSLQKGFFKKIQWVNYPDNKFIKKGLYDWKRAVLEAPSGRIVKLFFPRTMARKFYYSKLRQDPSIAAYRLSLEAVKHGISVAEPIACGQISLPGKPFYSYFISRKISPGMLLSDYINQYLEKSTEKEKAKAEIFRVVTSHLSDFHLKKFYYYDIKPDHIFVNPEKENVLEELICIDIDDNSRFGKELTKKQRVKNLYQCWRFYIKPLQMFSLETFVKEYCLQTGTEELLKKNLVPAVQKKYEKEMGLFYKKRGISPSLSPDPA